MLLQGGVVPPVGDGGEIQVRGLGCQAALAPDAGEGSQQALVHGADHAVGIGGEPSGLGQDVEAGEEARAAVHAPEVVAAVAAHAGELEGEEGQHGRQGGQRSRAGEAGLRNRLVNTVAPHPGQQAEHAGGGLALEGLGMVGGEQDAGGSLDSRRGTGEALGAGAPRQAQKALVLEHVLNHALAGGARLFGVEPGLDVGHGKVALAQGDDALAEVLGEAHGGAPAGHGLAEEEGGGIVELAEVAGHVVDGAEGIAEALGDLAGGAVVEEEGAHGLEAAVERLGGAGEEVGDLLLGQVGFPY